MLGLRGHADERRQVELVVDAAGALLRVHGGALAARRVEPVEALGEHRAVRLDRRALSLLQAVAGVVAREEGVLDVCARVQDELGNLLVASAGVELSAEPWAGRGRTA